MLLRYNFKKQCIMGVQCYVQVEITLVMDADLLSLICVPVEVELGNAHVFLTQNPGFMFCVFSFLQFRAILLWVGTWDGDGGTGFGRFAPRYGC
jgi:hypothetical protein